MKYLRRPLATLRVNVLMAGLLVVTGTSTYAQDEPNATDLGDAIREFNEAFGGVVDGEMTPEQIAEFERMIAPAFELDDGHRMLCYGAAYSGVGNAAMLGMATGNPYLSEMAEQVRRDVVPGSLHAWLMEFSAPLILGLGQERAVAAASHQCLQQKYVYALYPDVPMDSAEMDAAEECLLNKNC